MNWKHMRRCPWLDTRARFVAGIPRGGKLLDLGSSTGGTLRHLAELRPDLRFFAVDLETEPEGYPAGCEVRRADLERDTLPWESGSMDAITCMQVIEHLREPGLLIRESARLLKPGGRVFFETPHPKTLVLSSPPGRWAGKFCLNCFDASCHVRLVPMGLLAEWVCAAGLEVVDSGISRNWLLTAAYPFLALLPASPRKFTAYTHWLGWSAYLTACAPREQEQE
jgi:SAM-dependent methyltransferase